MVRLAFASFFFWCLQRQQIRVSDAPLAVVHSALYVADRDLGISYHALAVFSCGLCIPMSNSSLAVSHQCDPCNRKPSHLTSAELYAGSWFFCYWMNIFVLPFSEIQRTHRHCCGGDALVHHERFKITIFVQ